jgi:hypothetical protein
MTTPRCASIRRDRVSPPCGFGAKLPVERRAASQRITDEIDTPNRPAAARRLIPPSTAASARALKSINSGLPIPKQAIQDERETLYEPGRAPQDEQCLTSAPLGQIRQIA